MKKRTFNIGNYQYTLTSKKIEEPDPITYILEEIGKISKQLEKQEKSIKFFDSSIALIVDQNRKMIDFQEGDKRGIGKLVNQVSDQVQELKSLIYTIVQAPK